MWAARLLDHYVEETKGWGQLKQCLQCTNTNTQGAPVRHAHDSRLWWYKSEHSLIVALLSVKYWSTSIISKRAPIIRHESSKRQQSNTRDSKTDRTDTHTEIDQDRTETNMTIQGNNGNTVQTGLPSTKLVKLNTTTQLNRNGKGHHGSSPLRYNVLVITKHSKDKELTIL